MLLSFFIILNALSNFEDVKSQPVLNSISVAFSNQDLPEDMSPNVIEDPIESFNEGDTLDNLKALFESQITGVDVEKNRLGTVMHIRMPVARFEKGLVAASQTQNDGVFKGLSGVFLPTLVSLLVSAETIPYRMDMVMNLGENPAKVQNESPQDIERHTKKVAWYAQKIEEAGLPRKYVTAGLGVGEEKTIDLYFRRYEPFNPLGDSRDQPPGNEQVNE